MSKKWTLVTLVVVLACALSLPAFAEGRPSSGEDKLIVLTGTKQLIHNGTTVLAPQPTVEKKGTTYVAARTFVTELYGTVSYQSATKRYTFAALGKRLELSVNNATYAVDGQTYAGTAGAAPFVQKGTLMVPLRTMAQAFGLTMKAVPKENKVELAWKSKPNAQFRIADRVVFAEQTTVQYVDQASHPRGFAIVEERWEGREDIFALAGTFTVTRWVKDEFGTWSEPYSVTIDVRPPNEDPVAMFTTDKSTYKMGELVQYADLSTDEENLIVSREWTNNAKGFFEPGPQTITLKVTDAHGASSEYSQTITIANETLYSKEEFQLLYTDPGDKFDIVGGDVLKMKQIPYKVTGTGTTLIRSNSPEHITEEGIYYADSVEGDVRFLVHNQNLRPNPVNIYIIATNENRTDATVDVQHVGIGGPNLYVTGTGKAAVGRFLGSRSKPVRPVTIDVPAGESRVIMTQLASISLRTNQVVTMYADATSTSKLKYQVVVVDAGRDVLSALPQLPVLPRDGKHVRGTFKMANRSIIVNEPIGAERSRMIVADRVVDVRLRGPDVLTGDYMSNDGNNGALYVIRLNRVAPRTAIALNPRGGHYAGAFIVNGKLTYMTESSILRNANEAGMLYRTGDTEESVTLVFTPASGSTLPLSLLFIPLPELK